MRGTWRNGQVRETEEVLPAPSWRDGGQVATSAQLRPDSVSWRGRRVLSGVLHPDAQARATQQAPRLGRGTDGVTDPTTNN